MSTKAKALPPGWSKILDDVQTRLDQAITSANARMEPLPAADSQPLAAERREEIAPWGERLRQLNTYLESAEQVVQSVDELLHKEESLLRQQLANCETLRRKAG